MINVKTFRGLQVAVLGLARSGLATAIALRESGASVLAWDDSLSARQTAQAEGIETKIFDDVEWANVDALIVSPGVPLYFPKPNPIVEKARAANVEILGDIEMLARSQTSARFMGVTGTNGKSTTTALISHILKGAGNNIEVGGNLGMAALTLAPLENGDFYVLEMSSYQLDLTSSLVWDISVLLNLSPDHLERHGDMEGYVQAKLRIFDQQNETGTAIIGVDDKWSQEIHHNLKTGAARQVIPVSVLKAEAGGVYVEGEMLIDDIDGNKKPICSLADISTLPGTHNKQNACAAYAAARTAGLSVADIIEGLKSFPGLAHRQEMVDVVDGISYVNDSKATNAEAAAMALASYHNIFWIIGGQAKQDGIQSLVGKLDNVVHAFLIGEAAPEFAHQLKGHVDYTESGTLDQALEDARAKATGQDGKPVVLLSPACASFDQFASFEARGDHFRELVRSLPGEHLPPLGIANDDQHQTNGEAA